jgi:hypothetical protein
MEPLVSLRRCGAGKVAEATSGYVADRLTGANTRLNRVHEGNSMADQVQLTEAVNILGNLVRSVHLKRVLTALDPDPALNFWRVMHGTLLDIAVLEWCKLFGSDNEEHQKTHWKNVVANQDAFRHQLLDGLRIDMNAWKAYWQEMKNYRDQHVAHRDFNKSDVTHFPKLDLALQSSSIYYRYVITELRKLGVARYPDDLRLYGEAFADQAKTVAEKALEATQDIKERVY